MVADLPERWYRSLAKPRTIASDEVVIGALLPGRSSPLHRHLSKLAAHAAAGLRLPLEGTFLDPIKLVTAPVESCVLFEGGPGSGKTEAWARQLMMQRDAPIIAFDPQKNAFVHDVPLREALGRVTHVFDPDWQRRQAEGHTNLASVHALGGLWPDAPEFARDIVEITSCLITGSTDGSHADLRARARAVTAVVIANVVMHARAAEEIPLLLTVREILVLPEFGDLLEAWAKHGHPAFRAKAREFLADAEHDQELVRSVQFFIGNALEWLDDWPRAALVCGGTGLVVDPADLVGDRGRIDWILQPSQEELKTGAGLWRLLVHLALEPHLRRESAACRGLPKTMLLVDELPALGRFDMLGEAIYRHRQKGILPVYFYQSRRQVDAIHGPGTIAGWEAAATVRGYTQITEASFAAEIEQALGDRPVRIKDHQTAPGGGPAGPLKRWDQAPLVSRTGLLNMPQGTAMIIVQHKQGRTQFFTRMPFWFQHPLLRARLEQAMEAHRARRLKRLEDMHKMEGEANDPAVAI